MKMWCTKYAPTDGVFQIVTSEQKDGDLYVMGEGEYRFTLFKVGRDVFHNREEAVRDALKRRDKKIKGLEKQITRLRAMEFKA